MIGLHQHLPTGQREQLLRWLRGNTIAADAIAAVLAISHTWDDLIDKDKAQTDAEISAAFRYALVGLPRNPFWRAHQDELTLLLEHAIMDWMTANAFERENRLIHASHVLRCGAASLIIRAATIIGGFEHGAAVSTEVRAAHLDDFGDYCREHGGLNDGMG